MSDFHGWETSANAWIDHVDRGDANRIGNLDPVVLRMLGGVSGKRVLDVGSGEGRFCRMLREMAALVVGVDPTQELVQSSRARDRGGQYVQAFAENLPFADSTFDAVVSYLSLIDIADYKTAITEMSRVLRPGGRLVVANLNGFATAALGWHKDEVGNRLFWPMDNYPEERAERVEWAGISIINYHRPLSNYMKSFLGSGLVLREFEEPVPSDEMIERFPNLATERRVPLFVAMHWEK